MRVAVLFLALLLPAFSAQPPAAPQPANPNANAQTRAVLAYLYNLDDAGQVISGQFGAYGDGTSYTTAQQQLQRIRDRAGVYPALTGMDYAMPAGIGEANRYLIDRWREGYLITVSYHMRNPCTGGKSTDMTLTPDCTLRLMTTAGTPANARLNAILDTAVAGLLELQRAGVVVLWRPFHEANGGWFFWFTEAVDAVNFRALWIYTYHYLTTRGLNNLLWVYSPNAATQWSIERIKAMYPGDSYVDVVSLDKYMSLLENPLRLNDYGEYDWLASTGKPFGLFEWGAMPASGAGWNVNPYPYRLDFLIRDLRERYPRIVLFQAWEHVWQLGRDQYQGLPDLMAHPAVLTLGELPRFDAITQPTPSPSVVFSTNTPLPTPSLTPTSTPARPQIQVCAFCIIVDGRQQ